MLSPPVLPLLVLLGLSGYGTRAAAEDPTLYEHYTAGGIKSGLSAASDQFALNGKPFVIYGGSFHYFRVVPEYWQPVLRRFRAAGLNAVQLYLPWNWHEETPGNFDFKSPLLNLEHFLELIKAEDMFAIVRIGPFICAEWEFGGFPSWLIRDDHMQLRENYKPYLDRVKLYWTEVMKIVNRHQFTTTGGPVIMLQIENEYFGWGGQHSGEYLRFLHDIVIGSGFRQLLFTSDPNGANFPIKDVFPGHDVLETANLNHNAYNILMSLRAKQPNRPSFVSEFWPGWFDEWKGRHNTYSVQDFDKEISDILFRVNGSVNFYMFIGGTNFGFMNGDRVVTSYDYDAPLSESGNYTPKYHKTLELYHKAVEQGRFPRTRLPEAPTHWAAHAYGPVAIADSLPFETLLGHARRFPNQPKAITMEMLNYDGKDYGQRFGWILYRVETNHTIADYEITGTIYDRGIFMLNGEEVGVIEEDGHNLKYKHTFPKAAGVPGAATAHYHYDIMVENLGRHKFGDVGERKGIHSDIKVDGQVVTNLTIFSLDFDKGWIETIKDGWDKFDATKVTTHSGPALYRARLTIPAGDPADSYLSLPGWTKGQVFVNGFNLGRYWSIGPQKTLYVPAPLLHKGDNIIHVFELHKPGQALQFGDRPELG